jgi:prolyl 4-hydroxylase
MIDQTFGPQTHNKNYLTLDGRVCNILFESRLPRVVLINNFISDSECQKLIEYSEPKLIKSKVVNSEDSLNHKPHPSRTSSGVFFHRNELDIVSEIDYRISLFTNWSIENQEALHVLKYDKTEEYKPHYDYFNPTAKSSEDIIKRGGQRIGTIIVYLNTCMSGGSTIFPDVGLDVKPIKGNAIFFSYPKADKTSLSLHGGAPVLNGKKWIAVKWLRERKFV